MVRYFEYTTNYDGEYIYRYFFCETNYAIETMLRGLTVTKGMVDANELKCIAR